MYQQIKVLFLRVGVLCIAPALTAALFAGGSPAEGQVADDSQNLDLAISCSGVVQLEQKWGSLDPIVCNWEASGDSEVFLRMPAQPGSVPRDSVLEGPSGTIRLPGDGPYSFIATGSGGDAQMRTVGRVGWYQQVGSAAALYEFAIEALPPPDPQPSLGLYRADFGAVDANQLAGQLISVLHERGFLLDRAPLSDPADSMLVYEEPPSHVERAIAIKTSNFVHHPLLCDSTAESDCDRPISQRRIQRKVGFVIRIWQQVPTETVMLSIEPIVLMRYRREGGPYRPEAEVANLAAAVCAELTRTLKNRRD